MSAALRLAGVVEESVVDGPGFRLAVFFQGCEHHCPGCHNPHTHDLSGGYEADADAIIALMDNALLRGVTLTGGEPFLQVEAAAHLARAAHAKGLSVMTYTGFLYEALLGDEHSMPLLRETDILVDGRFVEGLRAGAADFTGSSNQRLLDVAASLHDGSAVGYEPEGY